MTEPDEQPSEPIGWQVTDPSGEVVASGPQVALEAVSDAGEAGDLDGGA